MLGWWGMCWFPLRNRAELCSSCLWVEVGEGSIPESLWSQGLCQAAHQLGYKKSHMHFRGLKTSWESNKKRKEIQILFLSNTIHSFTRANQKYRTSSYQREKGDLVKRDTKLRWGGGGL